MDRIMQQLIFAAQTICRSRAKIKGFEVVPLFKHPSSLEMRKKKLRKDYWNYFSSVFYSSLFYSLIRALLLPESFWGMAFNSLFAFP